MNRRQFLGVVGSGLAASQAAYSSGQSRELVWSIFSRHLQWVSTEQEARSDPYGVGIRLGEAAAQIGYGNVDLTVRFGGLVLPEQVNEKLPLMISGIKSTGMDCDRITTFISPPPSMEDNEWMSEQMVQPIYSVAGENGVSQCRIGTASYLDGTYGQEMLDQLDGLRAQMEKLAKLGEQTGVTSVYHTWNRGRRPDISTAIWDLVYVLKDLPPFVGINFDIGHILKDGPQSLWKVNLRYAIEYVKAISLHDIAWSQSPSAGWQTTVVKSGEGMVPWQEFFQLLYDGGYEGLASMQIEHQTMGAIGQPLNLNQTFWADHADFLSGNATRELMLEVFEQQLDFYKQMAGAAGYVF